MNCNILLLSCSMNCLQVTKIEFTAIEWYERAPKIYDDWCQSKYYKKNNAIRARLFYTATLKKIMGILSSSRNDKIID